jgi:hypothetical protein
MPTGTPPPPLFVAELKHRGCGTGFVQAWSLRCQTFGRYKDEC